MIKIVLLLTLSIPFTLATSSALVAQERYGTIAVVRYDPARVIVAADSRHSILKGTSTSHNDLACKVTALGDHVAFVAAGLVGYDNNGPKDELATWRAELEAHRVYTDLTTQSGPWQDTYLDELASKWGDAVRSHLISSIRLRPLEIRASAVNGLLATALIATGRGKIIQVTIVRLKLNAEDDVQVILSSRIAPNTCPPCALGKGEIVTEILELKTERAKIEMDRLTQELHKLPDDEREIHRVIQLAELTTRLHWDKASLGGPIDALELRAGEPVRWIQRKPECS